MRDETVRRQENPDPGPSAGWSRSAYSGERAAELRGLTWRKSSVSTANGDCVEVACLPVGDVAVRDSKDKNGPIQRFSRDEWHQFISEIQDGISQES